MTSYADTESAELVWSPPEHPGQFVIKFRLVGQNDVATVVLPREKVVTLIGDFLKEVSDEEALLRDVIHQTKKEP